MGSSPASTSGPCRSAGGAWPALLRLLLLAALGGCSVEERRFVDRGGGGGAGGTDGAGETSSNATSSSDATSTSDAASSTGSGGSCTGPSDCPAPPEPCQVPACVAGKCGTAPLPEGTEIAPKTGDCQRLLCDGRGAQVAVAADEPEDDHNPCTSDTCVGTTPKHAPQPGSCPTGRCDDAGNCVPTECSRDAECGTSTECIRFTCNDGLCAAQPAPAGSLCNSLQDQCDGAGRCIDCVNSGGCGECCTCSAAGVCVPA
ncbi:hypothetical protein WMF39_18390 [Sorangium sp. So ce1504]|uniref:hypothetical protein n=1 Tax=Sorangium sp. So ce1504 TaxID=3133337 RepID=UPI003F6168E8